MNEKRKDRIKNAIIIFLVLLLILTFFSNTWMNRTLPEVSTAYVQSASISPKIRGTGTVEADSPYSVMVSQKRKISAVEMRVGDEVHQGDVLYTLEDQESDELATAEKALADLEVAYQTSLFSGNVPDNVITEVRNDEETTADEYQKQLKDITDRYDAAVAARDAAKKAKKAAQDQMTELEIQYTKESGENNYNKMTPEYTAALATYEVARLTGELELAGDPDQQAAIQSQINDYNLMIANSTKDAAQLGTYENQMQLGRDYQKKLVQRVIDDATYDLDEAEAKITKISEERTKITTAIATQITLTEQKLEIKKAQDKVEKLQAESVGATVTCPVDGVITAMGYKAGETTDPENAAAVIQVAGRDMITSFSVTNAQAKKVHVGDAAEPQNMWYYSEFSSTLRAIKNDPSDPAGKKLLEFTIVSPEVQAGQQVSLQIGQASQVYDLTVPNSAIRDDNNGKFILIVQSKSSPLGNRYVASRVDVEVVESDDTNTAINASLMGYEYVITNSSEPIKAGQYVRLANDTL